MPFRGRVHAAWLARHRHPWENSAAWQNWEEQIVSRRYSGALGRGLRLWLPVLVSLLFQVPTRFWAFQPGVGWSRVSTSSTAFLVELGITLAGPLALIAARRFPGPVAVVVAALASLDLLLFAADDGPPYLALGFAIVSAVVRGARIWAWVSVAIAGATTLALALSLGVRLPPLRIAAVTLGVLFVMGVGEGIRTRRANIEEMTRRVAERKQNEVQAERVRIAREIHDVLAHSLSQINVQAGMGLHLMDSQPDKAKDALAVIKETSKTALDEVRSVLGALRAEDGVDPNAPLVPEPDLSRLVGLVASIEAQGIEVDMDNRIDPLPPAAAQLALYRIAQESLTNVLRHSKAKRVTLTTVRAGQDYQLEITDDGIGSGPPKPDSGGRGLLGMRERAELLGGTLEAGARPGGGFRVLARIPARHEQDR
ncbi:sensor histidine kinase [soil metagenome]